MAKTGPKPKMRPQNAAYLVPTPLPPLPQPTHLIHPPTDPEKKRGELIAVVDGQELGGSERQRHEAPHHLDGFTPAAPGTAHSSKFRKIPKPQSKTNADASCAIGERFLN